MKRTTVSERALIHAPKGRDAAVAADVLNQGGLSSSVCPSLPALIDELNQGAAFVVVTEEAMLTADLAPLAAWLADQQEWSDLPFIMLTSRAGGLERNPAARRFLDVLGNVTFLERPFHPTTLISLARSALRGRRRQYEARARLDSLRESEARFRAAVSAVQGVIWTNSAEGRMRGEQASWSALTGQSFEEYQDFGWADAVHPDDADGTIRAWNEAVAARSVFEHEHRVRRAGDGSWRLFAIKAVPTFGPDGRLREWVGVHTDVTEQRKVEAALRESEERFRNMADNAPVMMWVTDPDGSCTYLNRRWYEFTGQTEQEALGLGWTGATHPDDRQLATDTFLNANAAPAPFRVEYRLRRADGAYRWAIDTAAPRFGSEGEFLGYVGSVIDIDERKEVEDALKESQAQLQAVFDAVPVGLVLARAPSGTITRGNAQVERIFGHSVLPANDIADYRSWISRHPDGRPVQAHEYPLARVIAGGAERPEMEVIYRRGDGREAWVRLIGSPIRDAEGRVTGGVVAALDIDREKRTESSLRQLNETLETRVAERTAERDRVWTNSRDLLAVVGGDGIFRAVNPAWTAILGHEPSEVVGRSFGDFVWPEDAEMTERAFRDAAAGRDLTDFENRYRHRGGDPRWISWRTSSEGDLVYAYGRDVTAERLQAEALSRTEEALRQSQKLEAVGQLTGGVAHDFNNLLTIIKSSTELLRRDGLPEDRRRRYVDAISETVDRASKLTGQLLSFARRQALKPEVFDATSRVEPVADMLRTIVGSRVQIVVKGPPEPCFVEADASQFETALVNMAVNARDAMDGEGRLEIRLETVSAMPPIRGHAGTPGRFVAISLTDTGHGIPAEQLGQIFEPFFTTKEVGKGTGLGLSQVFGFAKQSGGDVAVESDVGRGTRFTLYLPQVEREPVAEEAHGAEADGAVHGSGRRVLVVEDNLDVGRFSTQVLNDLGYETTWAANGSEALRLLAEANGFDVVFSDIVMPGMSGVALGQEIRNRYPDLPVVLTSGYSEVLADEGRHGFELIQKPYAAEELSRVLRGVVRRRRA